MERQLNPDKLSGLELVRAMFNAGLAPESVTLEDGQFFIIDSAASRPGACGEVSVLWRPDVDIAQAVEMADSRFPFWYVEADFSRPGEVDRPVYLGQTGKGGENGWIAYGNDPAEALSRACLKAAIAREEK